MPEKIKQAMAESMTTRRFETYALGLFVLAAIAALCIVKEVGAELAAMVLGALSTVVMGALGFGSSHDTRVRSAAINAAKDVAINASQDLAKTSSQDIPRVGP